MKNRKGYSLLEIILVLALISIVIGLIFSILSFSQNNFNNQNKKSDNITNARFTMDYLTREIRKSNKVSIKDSIITIDKDTYIIQDRKLIKNDRVIISGIDELIVKKINSKIDIKIIIKNKDNDYELSSTIYER